MQRVQVEQNKHNILLLQTKLTQHNQQISTTPHDTDMILRVSSTAYEKQRKKPWVLSVGEKILCLDLSQYHQGIGKKHSLKGENNNHSNNKWRPRDEQFWQG